jgi:hypothetical protein
MTTEREQPPPFIKLAFTTFFVLFINGAFAQELIRKDNLGQSIQDVITKNALNINWNYIDAVYPSKSNTIKKGQCLVRGFYSQLYNMNQVDSSLVYFNVRNYYDKKRNRYKNIFWKKVVGITILDKQGNCRAIGVASKKIKAPKI